MFQMQSYKKTDTLACLIILHFVIWQPESHEILQNSLSSVFIHIFLVLLSPSSTVFKMATISSAPNSSANPIGVKEPNNGIGRCFDRLANNFTASDCLFIIALKIGATPLVVSVGGAEESIN